MSLLDKQEVQDICAFVRTVHCVPENGADLNVTVHEHQKIRHYRTRSTEEKRKKKKNAKSRFFTSPSPVSIMLPVCHFAS